MQIFLSQLSSVVVFLSKWSISQELDEMCRIHHSDCDSHSTQQPAASSLSARLPAMQSSPTYTAYRPPVVALSVQRQQHELGADVTALVEPSSALLPVSCRLAAAIRVSASSTISSSSSSSRFTRSPCVCAHNMH